MRFERSRKVTSYATILSLFGFAFGIAGEKGTRRPQSLDPWNAPLFFTEVHSAARDGKQYIAAAPGLGARFLEDRVEFRVRGSVFELRFPGSTPEREPLGEAPLAAHVNYLIGSDPRGWMRDLQAYRDVTYHDVYPGIDVRFGAEGTHIKSEFLVAPRADSAQIHFVYRGLGAPYIDSNGDLAFELADAGFREQSPKVFQIADGNRMSIPARYRILANNEIGFELGTFDPELPLIIDPAVTYSSYVGKLGDSAATAIAADSGGNVYVTGYTDSTNFPLVNQVQSSNAGSVDAFVFKMNSAGSALTYATYVGGAGDDRGYGIAIDSAGEAYVTGTTTSTNFPLHAPIQGFKGSREAFVFKLNAAGNGFIFSTFLGGSGVDNGNAIAVDSLGNAYVAGDTTSTDFPTLGPAQAANKGNQDAFVAKLSGSGTLVYSTYLGGNGSDRAAGIAVDSAGNAYVTGGTFSTNFPTVNPVQASNGGGQDCFITKLNAAGNSFVYSTYLGGSGGALGSLETGSGIAVDNQGSAYVAGMTPSSNFPVAAAFQLVPGGGYSNAFVAKLNPAGSALVYSTYLGGSVADYANAIAVDTAGDAYVAGFTSSSDFPLSNPLHGTLTGGYDAFLAELNASGNSLTFSTFYGGSGNDAANGVAVDGAGSVYVAGQTVSSDFPIVGGVQTTLAGSMEAFVVKLNAGLPPNFSLSMTPGTQTVADGSNTTYTVTVTPSNGFSGVVSFGVTGLPSGVTGSFSPTTVTGSGTTTLTVTASASGLAGSYTATVTGTSGSLSHTTSASLTVTGGSSGGKLAAVSVTPGSGTGMTQIFAFLYTDPNGAADIASSQIVINSTLTGTSSCYLFFVHSTNVVYVASDAGSWQGPLTIGTAGTLGNSQCTLNSGNSSVNASGNNLTVNLAITFAAGYTGTKNVYMEVRNATTDAGWVREGTWTVGLSGSSSSPPTPVSVNPNNGNTFSQIISFLFSDLNGANSITSVQIVINATLVVNHACYIYYTLGPNQLYLGNDAGVLQGPSTPGAAGLLQNGQCSLNAGSSSVVASGTNLTLNLALTFASGFAGSKNIYMEAAAKTLDSGWTVHGAWLVP